MDFRPSGSRPVIRASDLRRLILRGRGQADALGLQIAGAQITGRLDLSSADVPFPLVFDDCEFREPLQFEAATLGRLAIRDCALPGLAANGVSINGDLDLSGSAIRGSHSSAASTTKEAAVWLAGAEIRGSWLCARTVIAAPGKRAIHADGIRVAKTIRFIDSFHAKGQIRLLGADIAGSLHLGGVHIEQPVDALALDLGDASIAGGLFIISGADGAHSRIEGQIDLGSARIGGQCLFRAIDIAAAETAPPRPGLSTRRWHGSAISAPRLTVGADLIFDGECEISGGMDLSLCEVGDIWINGGVRLSSPRRIALDLTSAQILGSLTLGAGLEVVGRLDLTSSKIGGRLTMVRTTWTEPLRGIAVNAPSSTIGGDIDCHSVNSVGGGLNFRAGGIGGNVDFTGANLDCPDAPYALNLSQAAVGGSANLCGGLQTRGAVVLDQASVKADVDFTTSNLSGGRATPAVPGREALRMRGASVRGRLQIREASFNGDLDLTDATVSVLEDNVDAWPASYSISGLVYGRFADSASVETSPWACRSRIRWVRNQRNFDAGAFEQLARVFRGHGYVLEAERVLMEELRRASWLSDPSTHRSVFARIAALPRAAWALTLDGLVGFGFRPARVIYILASLTTILAIALAQPAQEVEMRSVDPQGVVFTVSGPLVRQGSDENGVVYGVCGGGQVRCFNPVSFAVETVLPLVSLGQRDTWYPNEETVRGQRLTTLLNLCSLLGWLLSSVFLLSFTRLARER